MNLEFREKGQIMGESIDKILNIDSHKKTVDELAEHIDDIEGLLVCWIDKADCIHFRSTQKTYIALGLAGLLQELLIEDLIDEYPTKRETDKDES